MQTKIYCPDIECDSCVKVLSRVLSKLEGINKFIIRSDHIEIDIDESLIKINQVIEAIQAKGYRASLEPIRRKRVRARLKEFIKDRKKYSLEHSMLRGVILSFIILLAINAALYFTLPQFNKFAVWMFYLALSTSTITGAIWHFKAHRAQYTCMVGMMVGMTIGMQTGMMIGFVLGATNGFFMGALVGMIAASIVGALTGKCCGIMGVMEGIMAGIMGGTMGPMISVMMFNENIQWFLPPYMALNIVILAGLAFMIYEEVVEDNDVVKEPVSTARYLIYSTLSYAAFLAIMLLTPASIFLS